MGVLESLSKYGKEYPNIALKDILIFLEGN